MFAVSLTGHEREVTSGPGDLVLLDVARDGRVLLAHEDWRSQIYAQLPGENRQRDLSWFDFSISSDLSPDGKMLLFIENGESSNSQSASYVRRTDGSPAIRLNDGLCWALSKDGEKVVCQNPDGQLIEVPTKTGQTKQLTHDNLVHGWTQWLPGETGFLFLGQEPGHGTRAYVQTVASGQARAITPEGATIYSRLSPDGSKLAIAMGGDYRTMIFPVNAGDPQPVAGLQAGEVPVTWSSDGLLLYCFRIGDLPLQVYRIDLRTGRRTPWKLLVPPDPVGMIFAGGIMATSDWKSYVYTIQRRLDVLYLVEGLH